MTVAEAKKLEIGDEVELVREHKKVAAGEVTQTTHQWFMVTWSDGFPEVIRRDRQSILLTRLARAV